ncbi:MAG: hypothetical protein GWN93_02935 [Deltaproteobacteria bacterium]|nr:hypothetical protein [Deltaproteobacteria bacterium]
MINCQVFSYSLGGQNKAVGSVPIPFYSLPPLKSFCPPSPPSNNFLGNCQKGTKPLFFIRECIPYLNPPSVDLYQVFSFGFYKDIVVVDGLKNNFCFGFLPFRDIQSAIFFVFQIESPSTHQLPLPQKPLTIVNNCIIGHGGYAI